MRHATVFNIFITLGFVAVVFITLYFGYLNDVFGNISSTPVSFIEVCAGHGDVDCSVIKPDASVTCKDGTTDNSIPFIYVVPQCQNEIESLTQEQADFMTNSGCFPPSEMGCMNVQSYNKVWERLKAVGLENSELGKNELKECDQQTREYQKGNADYQACLAENNNPNFNLPGNKLVQPLLKSIFCPIFYGHSTYDPNSDMCFCDEGYFLFNKSCVKANLICQSKYGSDYYARSGNCAVQKSTLSPPTSSSPAPSPQKTFNPNPKSSSYPEIVPDIFVSPTKLPPILLPHPIPSTPYENIDAPVVTSGNFMVWMLNKFANFFKKIF